jgi:hypothetical protein
MRYRDILLGCKELIDPKLASPNQKAQNKLKLYSPKSAKKFND